MDEDPKNFLQYAEALRMNTYQKIAIFILRLAGFVLVVYAMMGLAYYGFLLVRGTANTISSGHVTGSIWWLVSGIIVFVLSKPLGKFLGRGLD